MIEGKGIMAATLSLSTEKMKRCRLKLLVGTRWRYFLDVHATDGRFNNEQHFKELFLTFTATASNDNDRVAPPLVLQLTLNLRTMM
jgi:hypothetical protein